MLCFRTPLGILRSKINHKLGMVEHETSFNRFYRARRNKVQDPVKYQTEIEAREVLGLPRYNHKPTPLESVLRLHRGNRKKKVTLPPIKF